MSPRKARQRRGGARPPLGPAVGLVDVLAMFLGMGPCPVCGGQRLVLTLDQVENDPEHAARLAELRDVVGEPDSVAVCSSCGSLGFMGSWEF